MADSTFQNGMTPGGTDKNGMAVASLVLGIIAVCCCCVSGLSLVPHIHVVSVDEGIDRHRSDRRLRQRDQNPDNEHQIRTAVDLCRLIIGALTG